MNKLSRRALLQTSTGAAAGAVLAAGPSVASARSPRGPRSGGLPIDVPRLNAGTGGTPLTPEVVRALDTPIVPVAEPSFVELFQRATEKTARVLDTRDDVLLIPGEAIVALEAAFRSVTRPGLKVLNVISGVYGADYTNWLEAYGAEVTEVRVPFDSSVDPAAVEAALARNPGIELLTVVHVDTPSGTANDIAKIGRIARRHGVVTLVDAASTVGGMPLFPERFGVDIVIGAAHKAIGAPVGVGITTVSAAGWKLIDANTKPPEAFSVLSLEVFRDAVKAGRVPSTVSPTVTYGLYAALDRLVRFGVGRAFAQTAQASRAFRAGAGAAGIELWAAPGAIPADTNTTLKLPRGVTVAQGVDLLRRRRSVAAPGTSFTGDRTGETIRFGHLGPVQTEPRFVAELFGEVARAWRELGARVDVQAGERAVRRELRR